MSAHIIGRPNDDLLDIMLGHGAEPEQAFIRGSEQCREVGDGCGDHLPGDEHVAGHAGGAAQQGPRPPDRAPSAPSPSAEQP